MFEDMPLYKKIALGVAAVAIFGCVISGIRLAERSSDASKLGAVSKTPEAMTLAQLGARGPDGNANVTVSNVAFDAGYIAETSKSKYGVESIRHIWAVARVPGEAPGSPVRVLVKNTRVNNKADADAFLATNAFPGLVINKIDRPGEDELRLLRSSYQGLDPDRVVMVHAFREPPGELASFNLTFSLIAGLVALLAVFAMIWDYIPGLKAQPRQRKKKKRRRVVEDDEDD